MTSLFTATLAYLSKMCGLESVSSFPAQHPFARTSWNPSYFDIAYGMKPDRIEQALCDAIRNTPSIFAHISNPTPRMQRSLLAVLHDSVRRNDGNAAEWAALLIVAYASRYVHEVVPGLRAEIAASAGEAQAERVRSMLAFLANMKAPFDVIEVV
ncbi:MAG: hypothetical protein Q7T62_10115 [Undibacterium sp.]|nr:hypothetical protein [Undibacterium sp.]